MTRENKSFRTYARKHLADKIKQRRVTAQGRKEMKERIQKKEIRNAKKAKKADEQHAEDVAKLHETDPELYAFLEEEDPTLLQYGQVSADDDIFDGVEGSDDETDADDDAEDAEDAAPKKAGKKGEAAEAEEEDPLRKRVTRAEIDETLATDSKKIAPMISLFVSAARELNVKDLKPEPPHLGGCRKFADYALVKETLATAAKRIAALAPTALFSTVAAAPAAAEGDDKKAAAGKKKGGKKGDKKGKKNSNSNAGFVSTPAKGMTKRFLLAAAAVLSDAAQSDVALGAIVARALHPFVRVFHMIQGATKGVLRSCLALCACSQESARVAGYMVVLAVAKRAAGTHSLYQSAVFKGIFLTLIRAVHNYTARSLSVVSFLLNAVCDLYGTDLEAAYQHAFVYIRQLAVFLRAALQNPSQISSVRAVCNWQFVTALRTWALVASTYHEPKQLGPLIHPVVQIALGTIDLFASPRLVPLHLHVIETLNHLASRAHVFIPVAPHLLRILTSPSLALDRSATRAANAAAAALAKKKGGFAKGGKGDDADEEDGHAGGAAGANASFTDLQFMLRVKKAIAKTTEYKVNVWVEALYHLTEHLATLSCSFGFPEATWAVTSTLSKLRHDVKAPRLHATLTNLLRAVNQTTQLVESKRAAAAFGPSDTAQVKMAEDELRAAGTPLTKYYQSQRQQRIADFAAKQRALQANSDSTTLEGAAAAAMKKKKAGKRREREESSSDDE